MTNPVLQPAKYAIVEELIVVNDPEKTVEKCRSIEIHNMGTTIARVNNKVLLPDDRVSYDAPEGGEFPFQRFRIKFIGNYSFNSSASRYPQLSTGNKLLFTTIERI